MPLDCDCLIVVSGWQFLNHSFWITVSGSQFLDRDFWTAISRSQFLDCKFWILNHNFFILDCGAQIRLLWLRSSYSWNDWKQRYFTKDTCNQYVDSYEIQFQSWSQTSCAILMTMMETRLLGEFYRLFEQRRPKIRQ